MKCFKRYAEVFGLTIILIAAALQMFVSWNQGKLIEYEFYRTNHRLLVIFDCMKDKQLREDRGYCMDGRAARDWAIYDNSERSFERQVSAINWTYIVFYFLGGGIFLYSRCLAARKPSDKAG